MGQEGIVVGGVFMVQTPMMWHGQSGRRWYPNVCWTIGCGGFKETGMLLALVLTLFVTLDWSLPTKGEGEG